MAVKKAVKAIVKLQIVGGAANPSPPVGPALGQQGVAIMDFCKAFNAQTQTPDKQGVPLPVEITVHTDRTFTFIVKTPPASYLIKQEAQVKKGSNNPKSTKVGKVNRSQLEKIAKIKMPDLTAASLDAAVRTLAGSARSMGIDVEGV